jgi:arsenical pump membrane protein
LLAFRLRHGRPDPGEPPALRLTLGGASALIAGALVVSLRNAALPVLALGVAATLLRRLRPRLDTRALALLFGLAVGLGALARLWTGPAQLLDGPWATAGIGTVASVLINNLPAAVLLSAQSPLHPHALLLGLDVGPNLAITGSLSAILWLQVARTVGANASIATYSRLGLLLVPLTILGALAILRLGPLANF